jgi:hypothetical protein
MTHISDMPKMGRTLNHLEDLVFFYGSAGIAEIEHILTDLSDLSIKWDGKVALYYGRNDNGDFQMGTIGNWAKNTPCSTPDEMYNHIMTTGNGEGFRPAMANDLHAIFPYLAYSVPTSFIGFVKGDLLFSPFQSPKTIDDSTISFTPNQVTYSTDTASALGRQIMPAMCGIVLHGTYTVWGGDDMTTIRPRVVDSLCTPSVLVMGQSYVSAIPTVSSLVIETINNYRINHGRMMDTVLAKRKGLSDIPNIIYTFNNQTMRNGGDVIDTSVFFDWLSTSRISINKQRKLAEMHNDDPTAFPILFDIFNTVANAKNDMIAQLDQAYVTIKATTDGVGGGEGYVSLKHNVKLVPRLKWRPS